MTGQHEPLWKPEVKSGAPEDHILNIITNVSQLWGQANPFQINNQD